MAPRPDLAEFARDLAPGCSGILGDVHVTEEAERYNAVGVSGMRGKAHTVALGWVELAGSPNSPRNWWCGARGPFRRLWSRRSRRTARGFIGLDDHAAGIGQRPFLLDTQGLPSVAQMVGRAPSTCVSTGPGHHGSHEQARIATYIAHLALARTGSDLVPPITSGSA